MPTPGSRQTEQARSVLVFAFGNTFYLNLAMNLARSFLVWHPRRDIGFHLVTDNPTHFSSLGNEVVIHDFDRSRYGPGFSFKLHIDDYCFTDETLCVDSDCLCYGHLGPVFDRFRGIPVGVVATPISEGDYWGDLRVRLNATGVESVPEVMSCVYYIEKGAMASKVFQAARAFEENYEGLGMTKLRGGVNDEPLISLSIAVHGLPHLPEDGSIKADMGMYRRVDVLNSLRGAAVLHNAGEPRWDGRPYPNSLARPLIVHFHNEHTEQRHYKAEAFALARFSVSRWPVWACDVARYVLYLAPGAFVEHAKNLLRPAYRMILGVRRIRQTERVKQGDPLEPSDDAS